MTVRRDLDSYAHIYTRSWPRGPGDPSRCRAAVHVGGRGVGFFQCTRKPVVERKLAKGTFGFCKQHDPVAARGRDEARNRKWQAEWDAKAAKMDAARRRREVTAECVAALRTIEAGHNDPRQLARDVLAALDAIPKPGGEVPGTQE